MQHDRNRTQKPDPKESYEKKSYEYYDPDASPPASRDNNFGIPLLIAAFILVAALTAILLGVPRPDTANESLMPTAYIDDWQLIDIEPAAGDTTPNAPPHDSIISPGMAYITREECMTANSGMMCSIQSCARTDLISCPPGLAEAWHPSAAIGGAENPNTP